MVPTISRFTDFLLQTRGIWETRIAIATNNQLQYNVLIAIVIVSDHGQHDTRLFNVTN